MLDLEKLSDKFRTRYPWLREMFAEFIGTFILVFVGNSAVAQSMLSKGSKGEFISINFGYGFALMMAILVAGGVSGAHLNPAVTTALAIVGKCSWKKIPHYMIAQYLGAFVASPLTYLVYIDAIREFEMMPPVNDGQTPPPPTLPPKSAGIFTTYPNSEVHLSLAGGFFDQVVGTFILVLVVCAVTDQHNMRVPIYLYPLYIGLTLAGVGMALGMNAGYALNPARDLSPRVFVTIAGWGHEAFTDQGFWWIPLVGAHIGAALGALIYVFLIEIQIQKPTNEDLEEASLKGRIHTSIACIAR